MVMFQSPAWEQLHTGAALPGAASLVAPTPSRIKGSLVPALPSRGCTHGAHPRGSRRVTCSVSLPAELSANTCMFWVTLPRGFNVFILPVPHYLGFRTVSCSAAGSASEILAGPLGATKLQILRTVCRPGQQKFVTTFIYYHSHITHSW